MSTRSKYGSIEPYFDYPHKESVKSLDRICGYAILNVSVFVVIRHGLVIAKIKNQIK